MHSCPLTPVIKEQERILVVVLAHGEPVSCTHFLSFVALMRGGMAEWHLFTSSLGLLACGVSSTPQPAQLLLGCIRPLLTSAERLLSLPQV